MGFSLVLRSLVGGDEGQRGSTRYYLKRLKGFGLSGGLGLCYWIRTCLVGLVCFGFSI